MPQRSAAVAVSIAVALCLGAAVGCGTGRAPGGESDTRHTPPARQAEPEVESQASGDKTTRWTSHITAYATALPAIPNARLQLPRISPDSKWIAYLDREDADALIPNDSVVTGKDLDGVSLWVRPVDSPDGARSVAGSGACWPSWSPDGKVLLFVSYDPDDHRRSSLGLYDVDTGVVGRKSVGLRHMMMPTFNPARDRIAVSAYGEAPDTAIIFIVDPLSGQTLPGPASDRGAQMFPRWVGDRSLIFIELDEDAAYLMRWTLGDKYATQITRLSAPGSVFDARHILGGINDPLRGDGRAFAYYNMNENRVELVGITSPAHWRLPNGFIGGVWWGDDWFIAASDDRVELASSKRADDRADRPRMIHLVNGRWLPLWADHAQQAVILAGEDKTSGDFTLLKLWLTVGDED